MAHGVAARSGLNRIAPASPAANRPSPNWLTVRSSSSRQNSGSARTERQTAIGARASATEITSSLRGPANRQPAPQYKYPGGPRLFATVTRCWCHDGEVAHSEDPEDFIAPAPHRVRAGTLLLANTDLLEPTFRRSVIYVVEHNDGGTLGVVLNRPSETAVYNVLPQWAKLAAKPKTMFIGGPDGDGGSRRRSRPDRPGPRGGPDLRRLLGLDHRSAGGRDRARRLDCVVRLAFRC